MTVSNDGPAVKCWLQIATGYGINDETMFKSTVLHHPVVSK